MEADRKALVRKILVLAYALNDGDLWYATIVRAAEDLYITDDSLIEEAWDASSQYGK